ncbi:hypothetical protein [Candidatus Symbiopectobacterium sp.]|nr:hypothetical protein [Candidatus Symbiopectobacterium sp.]
MAKKNWALAMQRPEEGSKRGPVLIILCGCACGQGQRGLGWLGNR